MLNDGTFGFNRADANALLDLISTHDVEHEEIKPIGGAGGSSVGVEVLQYSLQSDFTLQTVLGGEYFFASATFRNISELDGEFTASGILLDTTGTAAHQIRGDRGLCVRRGSQLYYFVVEPSCNFDNYTPGTGGGGGTIPISPTIASPSSVSP